VNFGSKYTFTYIYSDYQPRKKLDESIIHIQLTLPALFSIITTAELELGGKLKLTHLKNKQKQSMKTVNHA